MSEYNRTNTIDTNECQNLFIQTKLIQKNEKYIQIFKYIRHTLFHNDPLICFPDMVSGRINI